MEHNKGYSMNSAFFVRLAVSDRGLFDIDIVKFIVTHSRVKNGGVMDSAITILMDFIRLYLKIFLCRSHLSGKISLNTLASPD